MTIIFLVQTPFDQHMLGCSTKPVLHQEGFGIEWYVQQLGLQGDSMFLHASVLALEGLQSSFSGYPCYEMKAQELAETNYMSV